MLTKSVSSIATVIPRTVSAEMVVLPEPVPVVPSLEAVAVLMRRYADVSMSLADACIVRMSELQAECRVFSTDSHFSLYRRFGRQVIPVISPHS